MIVKPVTLAFHICRCYGCHVYHIIISSNFHIGLTRIPYMTGVQ